MPRRVWCIFLVLHTLFGLGKGAASTKSKDSTTSEYSLAAPLENTAYGLLGTLQLSAPSNDDYGPDIQKLTVEVLFESEDYVRLRITDPESVRWEVPQEVVPRPSMIPAIPEEDQKYSVTYTEAPFTIKVIRKNDGKCIFKSSENLAYKDQYISIRTDADSNAKTYGLGESTRVTHALKNGETYTLWASDDYTASVADGESHGNLYSSYPHFMQVDQSVGAANGVMFFNSNGMDVTLSNDGSYIDFTTIGGIIDMYIMAGPDPIDVVSQLTSIVGRPTMMPYWSLGFHNCKWGYVDVNEVKDVVANYSKAGIPLDTQWMDIDYMDELKDFTVDPTHFPQDEMKDLVDHMHLNNQHFGMIIDPCIKTLEGYPAYDDGMDLGIFVNGLDQKPYLAQVWPGPCYFPDFLHPNAGGWWADQFSSFHSNVLPFDGIWIDMNEVSNFCNLDGNGQICKDTAPDGCPAEGQDVFNCCLECQQVDADNVLDYPPFKISNNMGELSASTLPMVIYRYIYTIIFQRLYI